MAKKTTVTIASEFVFATLRPTKNGGVVLKVLSNQNIQVSGLGIVTLDKTLPVRMVDSEQITIPINTLIIGDVVCIKAEHVQVLSTYTKFTGPSILIRPDATRHATIPVGTSEMHRAYDVYLSTASPESDEDENPPAPNININNIYNKLVKNIELPTIEKDSFYVDKETFYYLVRNINKRKPTLITGPSGSGKTELVGLAAAKAGKELHVIDMSGMTDPIAGLIGVHRLGKDGSYFDFSRFSEVIQNKHAVVLLDELNRAALESANILLPVTDGRRQLYCDVASKDVDRIIPVNATIIATANLGFEYNGTNSIDRALLDRFQQIEISCLDTEQETELLCKRTEVSKPLAAQIMNVISQLRDLHAKGQLSTFISTRYTIELAELIKDGWDIIDAFRIVIYPLFEGVLTEAGERQTVHNVVKQVCAF